MTYAQTLEYLYSQLPMYQRIGAAAYKFDLDNIITLAAAFGNPQNKIRTVHVAGTNGKGSVSHMLAAILQANGYKTGIYSSPHLKDFRERIKVDGALVPEAFIIDFVAEGRNIFDQVQPSFFEITTILSFLYFAEIQTDIAVIETGLGGRLDSTNIISPDLSVITNVSMDHQEFLGNSLEKIAWEKAGIIKYKTPVVVGETQISTAPVFEKAALEKQAPITFADQLLRAELTGTDFESLTMDVFSENKKVYPALGIESGARYQVKNALTALAAANELSRMDYLLQNKLVYQAMKSFKTLTSFNGRWIILGKSPLIVADCAHNMAGYKEAISQIGEYDYDQLHIVLGLVKEKDPEEICSLFPKKAKYYLSSPAIPRAMPVGQLKNAANSLGLDNVAFDTINQSFMAAKNKASKNDLVYVGGSIFVVAEVV